MIKYQLAKKIVGENSVYLATFGGSSVTAGHDNKFDQSYPIVFERRISAAMEAVGIQVSVHNIAQGANNCYPSNACYESMGGSDPDFINWYYAHYVFKIGIITIQLLGSSHLTVDTPQTCLNWQQDLLSGQRILVWYTTPSQEVWVAATNAMLPSSALHTHERCCSPQNMIILFVSLLMFCVGMDTSECWKTSNESSSGRHRFPKK